MEVKETKSEGLSRAFEVTIPASELSEKLDAKIEEIRLAERELIESPDEDFRFHSGVPAL